MRESENSSKIAATTIQIFQTPPFAWSNIDHFGVAGVCSRVYLATDQHGSHGSCIIARMLTPETVLQGRYRIVRQLGQGGMGAVYEAVDQRLDTTVALKETLFADERLRKQFEREARLLARLHHPALPRVSDHFSEDDGQFLVMQFIPGDDLSEMMTRKRGPFPANQVLTWADQLLDALDYLHTQDPQIVHRDIKPQNLKLTVARSDHPARFRTRERPGRRDLSRHDHREYLRLHAKLRAARTDSGFGN